MSLCVVRSVVSGSLKSRKKWVKDMYQVMKRDGQFVEFQLSKICVAITMAFEAKKRQYNDDIIQTLALQVTSDYEKKIKDNAITVEDIQDSVESVLIRAGYEDVAKRISFTGNSMRISVI